MKQKTHPIYVVLTMRSDFLGECVLFNGLPEALNEGQFLVPRMTRDERRAAIAGPVGVGGAAMAGAADAPRQRRRRRWRSTVDPSARLESHLGLTGKTSVRQGPLDLSHYEAVGGLAYALDRHAEKASPNCTPRAGCRVARNSSKLSPTRLRTRTVFGVPRPCEYCVLSLRQRKRKSWMSCGYFANRVALSSCHQPGRRVNRIR